MHNSACHVSSVHHPLRRDTDYLFLLFPFFLSLFEHNPACLISRIHVLASPGVMPFQALISLCHPLSWQLILAELLQCFPFYFPLLLCCSELVGLQPTSISSSTAFALLRIAPSLSESWPHPWEFSTAEKKATFALHLPKITQAPNAHQSISQFNLPMCSICNCVVISYLTVSCAVIEHFFSVWDTVLISVSAIHSVIDDMICPMPPFPCAN